MHPQSKRQGSLGQEEAAGEGTMAEDGQGTPTEGLDGLERQGRTFVARDRDQNQHHNGPGEMTGKANGIY